MDLRWEKPPQQNLLRKVLNTLLLTLVGLILICSIYFFSHFQLSSYFPIRMVHVYGINHVSQDKVQEVLKPLVEKGYFNLNVGYIRDRLKQMSWVSDIFVRRNWPDQVVVTIVEKNAIAKWNNTSLISEAGELFSPESKTYSDIVLPEFSGPPGKQMTMLEYFNNINRILIPLHAKISYLELTPYLTWKLTLDNGISVQIGHKDVLTRLTHFVKVYPKIVGIHAADVDYIDLRYPNGVAIRWKETV